MARVFLSAAAAFCASAAAMVPQRRLREQLQGDYELVTPVKTLAAGKRSLRGVNEAADVLGADFGYTISGFGQTFDLDLVHDAHTFAANAKHLVYDGEGLVDDLSAAPLFPAPGSQGSCLFRGTVNGEQGSRARISTCQGFVEGAFRVGGVDYFLQISDDGDGESHILYKNDHIVDDGGHCGNDDEHGHGHEHEHEQGRRLGSSTIPNQSLTKYVKLLLVNDHARYQAKGSLTHAHTAIIGSMMTSLYDDFPSSSHFDVEIQVVGVITFSNSDPWGDLEKSSWGEVSHGTLLAKFNEWRVGNSAEIPSHSAAHLLSGLDFTGSVVGLAGLGSICNANHAAGVTQATSTSDIVVSSTLAHELGHNLGLYHTTSSNSKTPVSSSVASACSAENGGHSIMSPNGAGATQWSQCAPTWLRINFEGYPFGCAMSGGCQYARYYGYYNSYPMCLEQSASEVELWEWQKPTCGDGIREREEQCDCGLDDCSEVDPCCDAKTCLLTAGSECSAKDDCCVSGTCKIWKPSPLETSKVCREAASDCDKPDMCDGSHGSCPADQHKEPGSICLDEVTTHAGMCFGGLCESHEAQCQKVRDFGWSSVEKSCSWKNHDDGDAACGALYCSGSNGGCGYNYNVGEGVIFVNDGTSCGSGKACLNMKCVPVADLPGASTPLTESPTKSPTRTPTRNPTKAPTTGASAPFTESPTKSPTSPPATKSPTRTPTRNPTKAPTKAPTTAQTQCQCCTGTFWAKLWCRIRNGLGF